MAKARTTSRTVRAAKAKSKPARARRPKWGPATETAYAYASDTASAKHAPKYVRQQCADFAEGLTKGSFPYSDKRVSDFVYFAEGLPVPMGTFGKSGRIQLAPPQQYWAAELYGRMNPDRPDRRQYREFYLVIPRKAGKSTFGAAACLYAMCDPDRTGVFVQCAGKTAEEARHVYQRAKLMVNASEELRNEYGMTATDRQIKRDDGTGAVMKVSPGNLKDGSSPVLATLDELHAIENPHPLNVLRSSFAATREPLLLKLTTAGPLPMSVGLDERELSIQAFKGAISLPNQLSLLYEHDPELGAELEDGDPRLWEAIQPMLAYTIEDDFYPDSFQKSLVNANAKQEFEHKLLCRWGRGDRANFIEESVWDGLPEAPPLHEAQIASCWIGVDGAGLHDFTALTLLAELQDGRLCAYWKILVPASQLQGMSSEDPKSRVLIPEAVKNWYRQGWIESCGDTRTDFGYVAGVLANWIRQHGASVAVVDQFSGNDNIFFALPDNFKQKMIRFGKYAKSFTPPTQELLGRIQDNALFVEKNPVARWCCLNAVFDTRISGTILPKKPTASSPSKIDALDSLILAFAGKQHDQGGRIKVQRKGPIQIKDIGYGGRIRMV